MELDVQDNLAINNLINRYGHRIDERQWSRLGELFTDDVIFGTSDFNGEVLTGLETLRESWKNPAGSADRPTCVDQAALRNHPRTEMNPDRPSSGD